MASHHTRLDYKFAPTPEALLFDPEISDLATRLYGVLARFGMNPDSCHPSHARLAALTGKSERSINRPLRELEEAGWIERFARYGEDGARISDGFLLHGERALERAQRAPERGAPRADVREDEPEAALLERESLEREGAIAPARTRSGARPEPDALALVDQAFAAPCSVSFDDLWALWKRKTGKGAARKSWERAARKATPETIYAAAVRLMEDPNLPETQFIPHLSTWLNQERWDDDPLPPRNGGRPLTPAQRTMANLGPLMEGGSNGTSRRDPSDARSSQRGLPS